MIEKIKKHMNDMPYVDSLGCLHYLGDFPPIELSYFGYNDSVANDLYFLSKDEIIKNNYPFQQNQHRDIFTDTISSELLPDSIHDVADDILEKIITSPKTQRQYKITKDELIFYRKHNIPLPRESFYERYNRRFKLSTSFKLYKSKSSKSGIDIVTCYDPKESHIVWSEDEYKAEFE
jgi:hypothetical protein